MIVMKFGGTLMGSSDAIRHSASLVASSVNAGTKVVVVPSAMFLGEAFTATKLLAAAPVVLDLVINVFGRNLFTVFRRSHGY